MNLVFFGSGAFGLPTLASLARDHSIRAVVTQPDKPAGRGSELTPTPIGAFAAAQMPGVPLLKPAKVNDPAVVAQVRGYNADAWVVIAFGQKLGKPLLDGVFAINLHASLLPRWRGAAPINAAILAGDARTGLSVITLADRMDAGLVLGRWECDIDPRSTAGELHDALAARGPETVEAVLAAKRTATLRQETQDESLVTIAPKLSKADGWVDFRAAAEECRRRIHGLTPWPGVTVTFQGKPLKLLRAAAEGGGIGPPGTIVDPVAGLVACGEGTMIRILEVHPAGKRPMPWSDFARGQRFAAVDHLVGKEGS